MTILTGFTNPDKVNKIRKSWSSGNPDCLVKTNVTGSSHFKQVPANIYLFKVNNRRIRERCEICSKLTIKHQNDVNDVVLVFLLLT